MDKTIWTKHYGPSTTNHALWIDVLAALASSGLDSREDRKTTDLEQSGGR